MRTTGTLLTIGGLGLALIGAAAAGVAFAPTLHGQTVRERPFGEIRTHILGGSSIGVSLRDVDDADVKREGLQSRAGAVVDEVDRDSPAATAGFRAGDIVTSFDGERIRSAMQLSRLIEETPDGRAVQATVIRSGKPVELSVSPQARRPFEGVYGLSGLEGLRDLQFDWRGWQDLPGLEWRTFGSPDGPRVIGPQGFGRRGQLGVNVQDVSGQLAEYFGASTGGALITSVSAGSPAEEAGLKAGDVILRINDRTVRGASDVTRAIQAGNGDLTITILRDRKEQTVKATIDPVEGRTPRRITR
jgi:C-terminal processing protease CtpA/Prc